jgi:hypothetical protein
MHIRTATRAVSALMLIGALSISSLVFADTAGPLVPSVDGFYLQWTPKTGTTHYTMVDETTCNGTTDYNRTTTVGNRDSYVIDVSSIPDGSKITQLDITPCASKHLNGGANSTMNVFYRFNGTNSTDAGNYSLTGTTPVALAATSFTSLSHFKSATSTLDVGAVLSAGNKGARLGRIAVQITYTTLNAPSSLTATPSGSQVALSWTDNSTIEDGFKIERQTGGTGSFIQIATRGANVTNFTDTGSALDTTYAYRVRAFNTAGNSAYSNTATASTAPLASSNLATTLSGSLIVLTWMDNSQTEANFRIERKSGTGSFAEIATVGANVVTATDNPVSDTYTYRVRASNTAGNSGYTNESIITKP